MISLITSSTMDPSLLSSATMILSIKYKITRKLQMYKDEFQIINIVINLLDCLFYLEFIS